MEACQKTGFNYLTIKLKKAVKLPEIDENVSTVIQRAKTFLDLCTYMNVEFKQRQSVQTVKAKVTSY